MKIHLLLAIQLLLACQLQAQKRDNVWVVGHGFDNKITPNDKSGNVLLDFDMGNRPDTTVRLQGDILLDNTMANICDEQGNLLFYTNGGKVYNRNHRLMLHGDSFIEYKDPNGNIWPQATLILPVPERIHEYMMITLEHVSTSVGLEGCRYLKGHRIDMRADNGLGAIVEKKKQLIQDSMAYGTLTAVKHANGRDWWFIVPRVYGERYYIGLLTPSGITFSPSEVFTPIQIPDGHLIGQAVFTPDGTKYIRVDAPDITEPAQISVFDFDRCTGALSNQRLHFLKSPGQAFFAGAAVSPDSRYLYVFNSEIAAQYDLLAPDIFATETVIGLWDGFMSGPWYRSVFWMAQLASDGRIYVASAWSTHHWHYIDYPNRTGEACGFVQHGIEFPVLMGLGVPNLPNYRLGPLDGSPCDTLGIDNLPLARWRGEPEDSLLSWQITFTDLSDYAPTTWYWTFGDGGSSTEQHPVHAYQKPGIYTVCLVVSNANGSDTLCREMFIEGEAPPEVPPPGCVVDVRPNPFNERIVVALNEGAPCRPVFQLYDAAGRLLIETALVEGFNNISTTELPAAVYFWRVKSAGDVLQRGKCLKIQ